MTTKGAEEVFADDDEAVQGETEPQPVSVSVPLSLSLPVRSSSGSSKDGRRKLLKKAPAAPKRFRSAFVCFVSERMDAARKSLPPETKGTETIKSLAREWKVLSAEEKEPYERSAERDKARYYEELSRYQGPMHVLNKRQKKPADAPKRSISAFLSFAQTHRPQLRAQYPSHKNTEISTMLAEKWRLASEEEKRPHIERELSERDEYHRNMALYRAAQQDTPVDLDSMDVDTEQEDYGVMSNDLTPSMTSGEDLDSGSSSAKPPSSCVSESPSVSTSSWSGKDSMTDKSTKSSRISGYRGIEYIVQQASIKTGSERSNGTNYALGGENEESLRVAQKLHSLSLPGYAP